MKQFAGARFAEQEEGKVHDQLIITDAYYRQTQDDGTVHREPSGLRCQFALPT